MKKVEKRLERWRNSKQDIPKEELNYVLDHFFPGQWSYGGPSGSHIFKVTHPKLKGQPDFGIGGDFTIPVKGGQTIKYFYLRKLLKAIEIIEKGDKL